MSIKIYLLNYKQFKFVLDEVRNRKYIVYNKERSHSHLIFVSLCLTSQTSILYNLINNNISSSSNYKIITKLSQMLKI